MFTFIDGMKYKKHIKAIRELLLKKIPGYDEQGCVGRNVSMAVSIIRDICKAGGIECQAVVAIIQMENMVTASTYPRLTDPDKIDKFRELCDNAKGCLLGENRLCI